MAVEHLKEAVRQALPQWLREDPAIRQVLREALIEALRPWEEVLSELRDFRREMEKQRESDRQMLTGLTQAVQQLIETSQANSDAIRVMTARLEEHSRRLGEHSEVIRSLMERVEEHSRRLGEHSEVIRQLMEKVERHAQVIERLLAAVDQHSQEIRRLGATIGAIGARWGLHSEAAFRDGMAALLQEAGWQVDRFLAMDPEGYVFGRPDQVEIDAVIRNGKAILIEIRSSVSRGDGAAFQRKAEFYTRRTGLPVARRILISPMVDPRARDLARQMGMEIYTYPEDVPPEPPAGG
ncbi:MAG: DUF3782 domain-containing protein [Thermoflexus hugenholtzii]|jgi:hypothetical protein|uniref:PD-(D/E)XK nuclease family protein n=1 Tax=Thermoflexus TaxID=1495649 RepID=UPI001C74A32A|nr:MULTISPECIES: DUF3782 domain-containing protein [Thermoflexus]QWK11462.1 MAG: DUF3782 domain-containing protein [Thermoflexus hugenholtzii]